ncbi:hypothetical protein IWX47DRAFT_147948 [Phyllosticta citricarpa]
MMAESTTVVSSAWCSVVGLAHGKISSPSKQILVWRTPPELGGQVLYLQKHNLPSHHLAWQTARLYITHSRRLGLRDVSISTATFEHFILCRLTWIHTSCRCTKEAFEHSISIRLTKMISLSKVAFKPRLEHLSAEAAQDPVWSPSLWSRFI